MPAPASRPLPLALVALVLAATTLSGCTGSDPEKTSSPSRTASTAATSPSEPAESESTDASESPSASEETESTEAPATETAAPTEAPGALRDRLLAAGEVPGFNQDFRWKAGATQDAEPAQSFGTCQRFALSSIGAESVAVRGYRPVDRSAKTDTAGELVAEFPDATTARRAFAVLTSWRGKCADRLSKYDRSDVGALEKISVPGGGQAGWYLLTYAPVPGDPDSQWFDAQGMALKGNRIAMVELILAGQDYNYDAGQEPMVAAVQRAAAKL